MNLELEEHPSYILLCKILGTNGGKQVEFALKKKAYIHMKKFILTLSIFSLPTFLIAAADHVIRPSEKRIAQRVANIERDEKQSMYIRHVVYAACAGLIGYGIYHNYINPTVEKLPMKDTPKVKLAELSVQFEQFKHQRGFIWWLEEKLTSGFQGFMLQLGLIMSMGYIGEKMTKKRNTIEAFLTSSTRLHSTLAALIEHTKDKQRSGINVQQQLVHMAYNNVVEDIEQLIAYMELRARCLQPAKAQAALHISRTLFVVTEKLGDELEHQHDKAGLAKSTVAFQQTVFSLVSTFIASFDREEMVTESVS
jgi:hypothetical protein